MISNQINKKGFTLIELLVVIAIIGLLSSVVLTSLNRVRARGRDTVVLKSIKEFQNALELYKDNHGTYPTPTSPHNYGSYRILADGTISNKNMPDLMTELDEYISEFPNPASSDGFVVYYYGYHSMSRYNIQCKGSDPGEYVIRFANPETNLLDNFPLFIYDNKTFPKSRCFSAPL